MTEALTILAILLSPLIALEIQRRIQDRKERRDRKLWIFNTLMLSRHSPVTEENVRALNMIDVAFYDSPSVRGLWHEYWGMLNNRGLDNEIGYAQRSKKALELITEMAKVLGYGQDITHLDVDRVYFPKGLADLSLRNQELWNETLNFFKTVRETLAQRPADTPRLPPPPDK